MQGDFARFSPKPRKIAEVFPELAVVPCQYTGAYGTLVMSYFMCCEICLAMEVIDSVVVWA